MSLLWTTAGTCAALVSNVAWITSSIILTRVGLRASPMGLNLGRGLLSLAYLGTGVLICGFHPMGPREFLLLGCSGLVGMAVGDTLFFAGLVRLGPRRTILTGMVGPVFTVLLGVTVLGERLTLAGCLGGSLALVGVAMVTRADSREEPKPGEHALGVASVVLASFCMACGMILAKSSLEFVPALQATLIRMFWAVAGLTAWGGLRGQLGTWLEPFRDTRLLLQIQVAVTVAVFGGFYLTMLALKCLDASVVAILTATEPLCVLPITALALGQPVRTVEILGAMVGVSGVILMCVH